ncbi:MAG: hypothetical protein IKI75_12140 [Lachnospiraceae bacterium]|nr:hypothetical protein [Lachnospiraceae bacterium]
MASFEINLYLAQQSANELSGLLQKIDTMDGEIEDARRRLSAGMDMPADVRRALQANLDSLRKERHAVSSIANSLSRIVRRYLEAESKICGRDLGSELAKHAKDILDRFLQMFPDPWNNGNNKGCSKTTTKYSYDPVNLANGNFIYDSDDLEMGGSRGAFNFKRFYNDQNEYRGVLGDDWNHNYEVKLHFFDENGICCARIMLEDGKEEIFAREQDGFWMAVNTTAASLSVTDTGYEYNAEDHCRYYFDIDGSFARKEDHNGFGFRIEYGEGHRIESVVRDSGEYYAFSYDENGYLRSVRDHSGRSCTYFVEDGKLLKAVGPDGNSFSYAYDEGGRLSSLMDPEGMITVANEYDELGRTVRQTFPDGSEMTYEYDDQEKKIVLTERNGSIQEYYRDEKDRIHRVKYPDGEIKYTYNERDQKTAVTDKRGNTTKYSYDSWGNISGIINPLGTVLSMTYGAHEYPLKVSVNGKMRMKNEFNPDGKLSKTEDALHRSIAFIYGEKGRLEKIRFQDGSEQKVNYDPRGNVTSITDPRGYTSVYEYDELNRVVAVTGPEGEHTQLEYDANGNITAEIYADGSRRCYEYDANRRLKRITDTDGSVTEHSYDPVGNLSEVIDQLNRKTGYEYDSMWNLAAVVTPTGARTSYEYDASGNMICETHPDGGTVRCGYDGNGNLISSVDEEGAEVRYEYDAADRLISVTGDEGENLRLSYDAEGHIVRAESACGFYVEMEYDEAGQLVMEKDSAGRMRKYTYTPMGETEKTIDEAGRWSRRTYLPGGNLVSAINYSDGTSEEFEYTPSGMLASEKTREGVTITYKYDILGRLTEESFGDSSHRSYLYDRAGNITEITDELGNKQYLEYSASGELLRVRDSLGGTLSYVYDEEDRLLEVIRKGAGTEKDRRIVYERDIMGRVTSVTRGEGARAEYSWNYRGELLSYLDEDGYLTKYEYTKRGDLKRVQYADGREAVYSYNALRQLELIKDWNGETVIENDAAGRAVRVVDAGGQEVRYSYGKCGERRSVVYPDGRELKYQYDEQLKLQQISVGDQKWEYEFDEFGRLKGKHFPGGIHMALEYDPLSRLSSLKTEDGQGIIDRYVFRYNAAGSRTGIEKYRRGLPEAGGNYEMEYDALGRLTAVVRDKVKLRDYSYDTFGNRLEKNEYSKDGTVLEHVEYAYSLRDQLLRMKESNGDIREYAYDRRGNLSSVTKNGVKEHEYVFGAINRLERASDQTGAYATYGYNGLGSRVAKKEYASGGLTSDISYVNDLTLGCHNLLSSCENGRKRQYVYDFGPIGIMNDGTGAASLLHDDLGSVLRMVDANGNITESYGYDEFGCDLFGNTGHSQPFGYTGYRPDRISGTEYAQAREYMPVISGFISADLVKGVMGRSGSYNEYQYCNGAPYDYVDLNGMFAILTAIVIGAVAGAAISAGANAVGQGIKIARGEQESFKWGEMAGSAFTGAVCGGVAVIPGAGAVATIAAGAIGAGGGSIISQAIDDHKVNWGKVAEETIVGGVTSAVFLGAGKLLGKAGEKVFGAKGGLMKRWKDGFKKFFHMDTSKYKDLGLIKNLMSRHAAGTPIGDKIRKYVTKNTIKKILENANSTFFKKTLANVVGWKGVKDLFKDGLKNLLPLYKDPSEKTLLDMYKEHFNKLWRNVKCMAKGHFFDATVAETVCAV